MKRAILLLLSLVTAGCSTCPCADFMDTFFKSRNACASPYPAAVQAGPYGAPPVAPARRCAPCMSGS